MYENTIMDKAGLADEDVFIQIKHRTPRGCFTSGVKNLSKLGDSMRLVNGSDGNWYLHSLHMHRLALDGKNCEPFEYLFVGYVGSKDVADLKESEFRDECLVLGIPEVMQTRFENQETR